MFAGAPPRPFRSTGGSDLLAVVGASVHPCVRLSSERVASPRCVPRTAGLSFAMILVSELIVDWIKHAFIIKFNRISPSIYRTFVHALCADARQPTSDGLAEAAGTGAERRDCAVASGVGGGKELSCGDLSIPVTRRLGFVPLPLLCLVLRVVGHDVAPRIYMGHPSGWLLCLLSWLVLCFVKVLTSITLTGFACSVAETPKTSGPDDAVNLDGIARFTLHGKRIMA